MDETVGRLERTTVRDPLARDDDPFAAFREVARLELEQRFRYRHGLGKASRFFLALEEGRLLATRCPHCGTVWLPPRPVCPDELAVTGWVELSGRGTLVSWTLSPRAPSYADTGAPYLLGYVALEGVSTLLLQRLRNVEQDALRHGLPVRAVFTREAVRHPLERFWFEPA